MTARQGFAASTEVRAEPRCCEVCGRAIAAGQLYVVAGPRHVACRPPARLDVQRIAAAARAR